MSNPINILIFGKSGSGKSSFINSITSLFSSTQDTSTDVHAQSFSAFADPGALVCTNAIQEYPITFEGQKIILIDTPGFLEHKNSKPCDLQSIVAKSNTTPNCYIYIAPSNIRWSEEQWSLIKNLSVVIGAQNLHKLMIVITFSSYCPATFETSDEHHHHLKKELIKNLDLPNLSVFFVDNHPKYLNQAELVCVLRGAIKCVNQTQNVIEGTKTDINNRCCLQ